MNNYLKLHFKNIDNIDEVIELNERINKLKTIISKNKNLVFELNNNENNEEDRLEKNMKQNNHLYNCNLKKNQNITFYIKMDENIFSNTKKEIDDKCSICYDTLSFYNRKQLICEHNLCYDCFQKWNKTCINQYKLTSCPICRNLIL